MPIFIFDEYQIAKTEKNKTYLSYPAVRFLCESVIDLANQINREMPKNVARKVQLELNGSIKNKRIQIEE